MLLYAKKKKTRTFFKSAAGKMKVDTEKCLLSFFCCRISEEEVKKWERKVDRIGDSARKKSFVS